MSGFIELTSRRYEDKIVLNTGSIALIEPEGDFGTVVHLTGVKGVVRVKEKYSVLKDILFEDLLKDDRRNRNE